MTTDGLFTIHSVTIPVKQNQPIKLIPFGDIHADSDLHAVDEWMEFIDYARKEKDAYFLGMGDYLDSWSASERHILRSGGLHDTSLKNLDLMQLTGAVVAEYQALPPSQQPKEILVDSIGLGAGVVDRLRELGLPARGINVSESPAMGGTSAIPKSRQCR